jgi:hypothetical protein
MKLSDTVAIAAVLHNAWPGMYAKHGTSIELLIMFPICLDSEGARLITGGYSINACQPGHS